MSVPIALVALALAIMAVAPRALVGRAWVSSAPRLGVAAWQASVLSVLMALALLAVTAITPVERISFDLGHVIHACPEVLQQRYAPLGGGFVRLISALVASATVLALLWATVSRGRAVRRGRQRQRQLLDVLALHRDAATGAHVLEHQAPLAYCVPGGGGRVVLTTGTMAALDERQLTAVLAHEHAHLDGHHDLVLFGADVAAAAFPWSRFFRVARGQLRTLVEMVADDEASRRHDPIVLATAIVDLGQGEAPEGAVGAAGDTVVRVERLISRHRRLSRSRRLVVLAASAILVLAPWVLAVAPAWAASTGRCD